MKLYFYKSIYIIILRYKYTTSVMLTDNVLHFYNFYIIMFLVSTFEIFRKTNIISIISYKSKSIILKPTLSSNI